MKEPEKNKGGRPTKVLDDEQIAQVEALGAVLSIEQIADYFGIAKKTFYNIMKRQPEVDTRYKRGKARAIGTVANALLTKARAGDTTSMIFYLKTQAGWRETSNVDVTTQGKEIASGPALVHIVAPKLDKDGKADG